jgi:hypothetical protein
VGYLFRTAGRVQLKERAVPGKDHAGKRVREEDVLTEGEDEDEDVVVHKRQAQKRRRSVDNS